MKIRTLVLVSIVGASLTIGIGGATAEEADSVCCGRLFYRISPDGTVSGEYPKQGGIIYGRMVSEGTAEGIWTQPRSDRPCDDQQHGSYAWGRFQIRGIGGPELFGDWGYCDKRPDHGWGFR